MFESSSSSDEVVLLGSKSLEADGGLLVGEGEGLVRDEADHRHHQQGICCGVRHCDRLELKETITWVELHVKMYLYQYVQVVMNMQLSILLLRVNCECKFKISFLFFLNLN